MVVEFVAGGSVLDVLGVVRPGARGWGMGQGVEGTPPVALLAWRSLVRGGRILMERSQSVASLVQFSSGALGGCMPKPCPPVA